MSVPSDEKFAKLTKKMRFLDEAQLAALRTRQAEVAQAGAKLALFELAQSEAGLTQEQLDKVQLADEYTEMLVEERRIGALAVSKGMASEEEVAICIDTQKYEFASQRALPRRLTEILIEAEILSEEKTIELMSAYMEDAGAAPAAQEPTIPYDTQRLAAVEKDVPDDQGADLETPLEASDPGIAASQGVPGKAVGGDGVTRRLTGRLILETGELQGRSVALTGRGRIGRQMGCMVRIDDSRASREHSQIDYDPQLKHHVVTDLESRNGTYVNDQKIAEPTILNPGDRIRIGDTVMRYEA